jgi:hypothetical protein
MASQVVGRLPFMLLAIIGLLILTGIFFGVLFPKAADESRTGIAEVLDKVVGKEKVKAGEVFVDSEHLQATDNLKSRFKRMRDSPDAECFLSYKYNGGSDSGKNGFPVLGEKGTSILLEKRTGGIMFTVIGGAEGLQEHSSELIKDVQPCVISGGNVPSNFYDKFVNKMDGGIYYNQVDRILIGYGLDGLNENRIGYNSGDFLDFEDGGILFKKDKNICFFPTVDSSFPPGCDGSSAEGLDDDCLGVDKTIIGKSSGRLKECSVALTPPRLGP